MRRVADAVGATPVAIYHHLPNREALLNSVTDAEFGRLHRKARPMKGIVDKLTSAMEAYIDYAFDRPRVFDYVSAAPRPGARKYPKDFRARRSPTLNPIADAVRQAMKEGQLRKDDVGDCT